VLELHVFLDEGSTENHQLPLLAHPNSCLIADTFCALQQVVMIDGREIGDGEIGPVTRQIQNAYKVLTAGQGVPIPRIAEV